MLYLFFGLYWLGVSAVWIASLALWLDSAPVGGYSGAAGIAALMIALLAAAVALLGLGPERALRRRDGEEAQAQLQKLVASQYALPLACALGALPVLGAGVFTLLPVAWAAVFVASWLLRPR
ncbi:hypothetical protein OOT46_11495 [Aquabacterium sp. A7-Y]|uniref:hypothetical protein n=1 Tax=Aquabacterium sp. A7-Y TaxID=1349605 RepID=UPI00223D420E|nr:hypothetical protein [Aquabacterium sp. A7-Y]MCW7538464.1 hypothetical protein [Aquabacterium sp. A7-Y]